MSFIDSSISNYNEPDTGPGTKLMIPPIEESYLPHYVYVSLAICEFDNRNELLKISVNELSRRIDEVIVHLHKDIELQDTIFDYFAKMGNLVDILVDLDDSGYLTLKGSMLEITPYQMEYLYIALMDQFNY